MYILYNFLSLLIFVKHCCEWPGAVLAEPRGHPAP